MDIVGLVQKFQQSDPPTVIALLNAIAMSALVVLLVIGHTLGWWRTSKQ